MLHPSHASILSRHFYSKWFIIPRMLQYYLWIFYLRKVLVYLLSFTYFNALYRCLNISDIDALFPIYINIIFGYSYNGNFYIIPHKIEYVYLYSMYGFGAFYTTCFNIIHELHVWPTLSYISWKNLRFSYITLCISLVNVFYKIFIIQKKFILSRWAIIHHHSNKLCNLCYLFTE